MAQPRERFGNRVDLDQRILIGDRVIGGDVRVQNGNIHVLLQIPREFE